MNKDFYNSSGCPDPTAYKAIQNAQRAEVNETANQLIKILKAIIKDNGFVLINRIELKDKASGTVFK